MRFRPLGKTGLSVSELALGTWGLSGDAYGPVPEAEQDKVIDRARALGITLFETADTYGQGAMERRLGKRLPPSDTARIVTKIGTDRSEPMARKRFDAAFLRESFEKSRERLEREIVDVVLLHNPVVQTVEAGEATAVLSELKAKGSIRAWGVSAGSVEVARAAIAKQADVISVAYNAFFSSDLKALHDDVQKSGVGVLARSVLAHGLLCGYWSLHKEFPGGDHRRDRWTSDELGRRVQQVGALRPLVGGAVYTMRAAALRYALANTDVSSVLLGPKDCMQLDQLVREGGKEPPYLTDDQLTGLANRLVDLGVRA
jgi:aryl-alcohol dehydrogenase-like predicted oxidoreductase